MQHQSIYSGAGTQRYAKKKKKKKKKKRNRRRIQHAFEERIVKSVPHVTAYPNFSDLFRRIVKRFRRTGYNLDIMRQTACLVFNPIMVDDYAALFSCTAVVQA